LSSKTSKTDAEAKFARTQKRATDAARAMSDAQAEAKRIDENTARLRALRMARDAKVAADAAAAPPAVPAVKGKAKPKAALKTLKEPLKAPLNAPLKAPLKAPPKPPPKAARSIPVRKLNARNDG
jgi:hypothetical protein